MATKAPGDCARCGTPAGVKVDGEWRCRACRRADPGTVVESFTGDYKWPSFNTARGRANIRPAPPANTRAERHGAYSPRRVDPLADEIATAIAADAHWLEPPDALAVRALARAEARVQLLSEFVDDHGPLDDEGMPRPALEALRTWEERASRERDRLGLTPLARARLGRDIASSHLDLARLWAEQPPEGA